MHRDVVNAMTNLSIRIGDVRRSQSVVDRPPRLSTIICPERASRRDRNEDPAGITRVKNDRVQTHPAGARLPVRPRAMSPQPRKLLPVLSAILGPEQRSILHSGI